MLPLALRTPGDPSTVLVHPQGLLLNFNLLKNAGIVEDEKRGTMVFYRLRVKCLTNFFGCVEKVLLSNAREQGQLVNLK